MNASMGKRLVTTTIALSLGLVPLAGCNGNKANTSTGSSAQTTQMTKKTTGTSTKSTTTDTSTTEKEPGSTNKNAAPQKITPQKTTTKS